MHGWGIRGWGEGDECLIIPSDTQKVLGTEQCDLVVMGRHPDPVLSILSHVL